MASFVLYINMKLVLERSQTNQSSMLRAKFNNMFWIKMWCVLSGLMKWKEMSIKDGFGGNESSDLGISFLCFYLP